MVSTHPPASTAHPDPRTRLGRIPLGRRVVVRHLIEDGDRATDALGELVDRDHETVTVGTRRGTVRIELAQVVAAKEVPPSKAGTWRIPSFLLRAGVAVLDLDGVVRSFDEAVTLRPSDHGTPIAPTVTLVDELLEAGKPTFILTNGTDRVPTELERMGLTRLLPVLLNSHTHGVAKPTPEAFARAHAEIESRLGRTVGRAEVHFTDDSPTNVDAARVFGWQARVFTLPPDGSA